MEISLAKKSPELKLFPERKYPTTSSIVATRRLAWGAFDRGLKPTATFNESLRDSGASQLSMTVHAMAAY